MKELIRKILKENFNSDLVKKIRNNLENAIGIKPEKVEFKENGWGGKSIDIYLKDSDYFFNCDNGFKWSDTYRKYPKRGILQQLIPNYDLSLYNLNFIPNIKVRSFIHKKNNDFRDSFYESFPYLKNILSTEILYNNCVNDYVVLLAYPKDYYDEDNILTVTKTEEILTKSKVREIKNFIKKYFNGLSFKKIILIRPDSVESRRYNNNFWSMKNSYKPNDEFYMTKEELFDKFLLSAKNKYGEIYRYDIENYIDNLTPMKIYCKKHKSYFEVTPKEHISGKRCPHDNESKGENLVRVILEKNKIPYKQYHKLKGCFVKRNERCFLLTFDFYLPKHNSVIEYDGRQHYEPVDYFGGEETYQRQVMLDSIKNDFCKDSGIKMIRIPYDTNDEDVENIILNSL